MIDNTNQDLERSGLNHSRIRARLKFKTLAKQDIKKILKDFDDVDKIRFCYKIPYFDVDGKETKYFRIRLFREEQSGFDKQHKAKYWQPAGTPPAAFFPRTLIKPTWRQVIEDPDVDIYITEGEKKAAAACHYGLACIALGGVWSFQSKKLGTNLIKDLAQINWRARNVYIVFDNDLQNNEQVRKAQHRLSRRLAEQGAMVYTVQLPPSDKKIGLDDYLLEHSIDEFKELPTIEYKESIALHELNARCAYIYSLCSFYDLQYKDIMSLTQAKARYDNVVIERVEETKNGEKIKRLKVFDEWLAWAARREYKDFIYQPGGPAEIGDRINTWPGYPFKPKRGSIKPFLKMLDHMFKNDHDNFRQWFLQWLAYPLQHPGTKLYTAVVLWSIGTGTGKTYLGKIMGKIYGENFTEIGQDELYSKYNYWAKDKQFALGDEITGTMKREHADNIKNMITRETLWIDEKYIPQYSVRSCLNYLFTSNHPDAFLIERYDRRFAVYEVNNDKLPPSLTKELRRWVAASGPSALFHYMLNEVDVSAFDPTAPAIMTESKRDMINLSLSDVDSFCDQLRHDPDSALLLGGHVVKRDLFTVSDLVKIYTQNGERQCTRIAMSKALRRAGFVMRQIRIGTHSVKKLWAIKNSKRWDKASASDWRDEYNSNVVKIAAGVQKRERKF